MEMEKIKRIKQATCEQLEEIRKEDLKNPGMVEFAKNLASLHNKLCEMCEYEEADMGSAQARGRDRDTEWGAYSDGMSRGSMRRDGMGRYARRSYRGGSYDDGWSNADPASKLREMMEDPNISGKEREALRSCLDRLER